MSVAQKRRLSWLIAGFLVLPLGGCALVTDVLAPGLPLELGLDPATIKPQQGVVMVAFNNTTRFPAEFFAYAVGNTQNLTATAHNFSAQVEAGQQQNEVLDCPVALISPGSLDASFQPVTTAVNVGGATGTQGVTATVTYTGPAVTEPDAYSCGDVIEIRLSATGAADTPTYSVSVRVIRGR